MTEGQPSIFEDRREAPRPSPAAAAAPWLLVGATFLAGVIIARALDRKAHDDSGG